MAESDKSPRAKVELGTPVPAPKTQTEGKEQGKAGNAASGDSGAAGSAAAGFSRVSAWVGKTFPGHENAFWGGVFGLVALRWASSRTETPSSSGRCRGSSPTTSRGSSGARAL